MRNLVLGLTFGFLILAWVLAIVWFFQNPDFEPVITIFALLATITGVIIERYVEKRERRTELLRALVHELYMNTSYMTSIGLKSGTSTSMRVEVFFRLHTSILEAVIASGAFDYKKDRMLFNLMHKWRQYANDFKHRLDLTEPLSLRKKDSEYKK